MITFLNKEIGPGGVSNLIINLSRQLIENGIKIKIIAYKNGNIYDQLGKMLDKLIFIDLNELKSKYNNGVVTNDDIIILTYLEPAVLYFKNTNPKIIFWNVFPESLYNLNKFGKLNFKKFTKSIIKKLLVKNALIFMDSYAIDLLKKKLNIIVSNDLIVPIPILTAPQNLFLYRNNNRDYLNVSFIGRAEIWKINSAVRIYKDLLKASYCNNIFIHFHIITDNPEAYINYFNFKSNKNCDVTFQSKLKTLPKLKDYLLNNIDINISMGTACIDGSSLGIPSIIMDASYYPINDEYRYKWIFQTGHYNLGELIEKDRKIFDGADLTKIIENFKNNYKSISELCYNYTKDFHDIKSICNKFLEYVNFSQFYLNDFNYKTLRYTLIYNFFRKLMRRNG